MSCAFKRNVVPALETTFSSIITLPKSFAPNFSDLADLRALSDPGALHVVEVIQEDSRQGSACAVLGGCNGFRPLGGCSPAETSSK